MAQADPPYRTRILSILWRNPKGDEGIFFRPPWKKAYCSIGPKKPIDLVIGPHREVKLEEVYPGSNSEESFAQGRITRHRHQAVGSYVVELQPVKL
jgi:hypothetical protein